MSQIGDEFFFFLTKFVADHPLAKQLIKILKKCKDNEYILDYLDVFKRKKRICIVLEYVPRRLLSLIKDYPTGLPEDYVKLIMFQLFTALKDLHSQDIVHRDIKPEKILLQIGDTHVKLGGFGLARKVEETMTPQVTTSWYRAPEVICEENGYGCPIDVWAAGLVMAELLDGKPLIPGNDELDLLYLIQNVIGSLSDKQKRILYKKKIQIPNSIGKNKYNTSPIEKRYKDKISKVGFQFLKSLLKCNPIERPTAEKCLKSSWFEGINIEKIKNKFNNQVLEPEEDIQLNTNSNSNTNSYPNSYNHQSSQASLIQNDTIKTKKRFPVRINGNFKVQIGSNSNNLSVVLHRIPRVKASDKMDHNIPSLGTLKVHRVDDYLDTVPPAWKHLGGIFVALYQSEALKIVFENCITTNNDDTYTNENELPPKAIKLAYGNINAKTGQAWKRDSKNLGEHFFVYPHKREHIDGVINSNDDLHQFCSSTLQDDILSHDTTSETMQIVMYEAKFTPIQHSNSTDLFKSNSEINKQTFDHAKGSYASNESRNTSPDPRNLAILPNIKKESTAANESRSKKRKGLSKYEILETVGEGTYGVVMKARDRETMQIVAIKKFKDSEYDDESVRKTTQREKKILQQLTQDNIVQLKEHFKRKGKMYLVFEYVPKNMLEALEEHEHGFEPEIIRVYMYQILKALEYCHEADIIHRDVKLENLLLHSDHSLKLCDFGFARTLSTNGTQTPYVSTRWYRAPELLVNAEYGKPVDIWAVGCIMGEIVDGKPLFPGTTDLDQLYLIQNIEGEVPSEHIEAFYRKYRNYKFPKRAGKTLNIQERYGSKLDDSAIDFMKCLLKLDPKERWTASKLLKHPYFDGLDIEEFFQNQREKLEIETKEIKVTGDARELPKLLTNWNQGTSLTPENFQDNLLMKPPIVQNQSKTQVITKNQHTLLSPSHSPLKKGEMQSHLPSTNASTSTSSSTNANSINISKQKTPRRGEKVAGKTIKQEINVGTKVTIGANRRRSSLQDEIPLTITKPTSQSSSRQSSRQSSRLETRKRNAAKDSKPPLPHPTNLISNSTISSSHNTHNTTNASTSHHQALPTNSIYSFNSVNSSNIQKNEVEIDFSKFGRFYLHIVNSEQYKTITGFSPDHEPIDKSVYEDLGVPWYEDYNEKMLPLNNTLSHIGFIQPKKIETYSQR